MGQGIAFKLSWRGGGTAKRHTLRGYAQELDARTGDMIRIGKTDVAALPKTDSVIVKGVHDATADDQTDEYVVDWIEAITHASGHWVEVYAMRLNVMAWLADDGKDDLFVQDFALGKFTPGTQIAGTEVFDDPEDTALRKIWALADPPRRMVKRGDGYAPTVDPMEGHTGEQNRIWLKWIIREIFSRDKAAKLKALQGERDRADKRARELAEEVAAMEREQDEADDD
jgi:hypothetical protein